MLPNEKQRSPYPREHVANLGMHYWQYGIPSTCALLSADATRHDNNVTITAITGAIWERIRQLSIIIDRTEVPSERTRATGEKKLLGAISRYFFSDSADIRQVLKMLGQLRYGIEQARQQDTSTERISSISGDETAEEMAAICTQLPSREEISFIARTRLTAILIDRVMKEPEFLGAALQQEKLNPFMRDYFFHMLTRETTNAQFAAMMKNAAHLIQYGELEPMIATALKNRYAQMQTTPKSPSTAPVRSTRVYPSQHVVR